jgi:hypothetical protein
MKLTLKTKIKPCGYQNVNNAKIFLKINEM